MYCCKCKKKNEENVYFCKNCGYNLKLKENVIYNNMMNEREAEKKQIKNIKLFTIITICTASISVLFSILILFISSFIPALIFAVLSLITGLLAMYAFNSTRLNYIPTVLPIIILLIFIIISGYINSDKRIFTKDFSCTNNISKTFYELDIDLAEKEFSLGDDEDDMYIKGKINNYSKTNENSYQFNINTLVNFNNGKVNNNGEKIYNLEIVDKNSITITDTNNNEKFTCINID